MNTTLNPGESPNDPHILAIAGSLRQGSWNLRLLEAAAESAPAGIQVRVYRALGEIPLFDEDVEERTAGGPPPVIALREAVARATGVLIATPEYNQSVPGVLKNAIDWLSRAKPVAVLAGKPVALIGASSGRWGTRLAQAALRQVLCATESLVMPTPALYLRDAARAFDADGRLADTATLNQLRAVLDAFARWQETVSRPVA